MILNKLGYSLALLSGFCASLASLYSKLLSEDYVLSALVSSLPDVNRNILTIASYGGVVVLNGLMWLAFVTALRIGQSSVVVMATNTLTNFAFSAVFGKWIYEEELNGKWLAGMLCLCIGIVLLLREQ